jgi:membrane protease YdiL (CAAX protease family)
VEDWTQFWGTVAAFLVVAVPAGLVSAALWWRLPLARRHLFPPPRVRLVPWGGLQVLFALFVFLFLPAFPLTLLRASGALEWLYGEATEVLYGEGAPLKEAPELWAAALAAPFQVALIVGGLRLCGARLYQLGLTTSRAVQNIVAGYLGWLVVTPVALALFALLTLWITPQTHLVERLLHQQSIPVNWVLIFCATVVAAPVIEELFFRGVLQPWLVRGALQEHGVVAWGAFAMACLPNLGKEYSDWTLGPVLFVAIMVPGYAYGPVVLRRIVPAVKHAAAEVSWVGVHAEAIAAAATTDDSGEGAADVVQPAATARPVTEHRASDPCLGALRGIYGTALLFAAAHAGAWPAPVPLFLLALALGWLAHRARSLVGPMVLHSLFNALPCLWMLLAF